MHKLKPLFSGETAPGVYRFGSWAKPESILNAVDEHGWQGFHVDGRQVTNKAMFIQQFASALAFPDYHGSNWDAFEDCITDMAWLPSAGYVILYDQARHFANHNPEEWQMAQTIMSEAVQYWQSKGQAMYVLLRGTWWTNRNIVKI